MDWSYKNVSKLVNETYEIVASRLNIPHNVNIVVLPDSVCSWAYPKRIEIGYLDECRHNLPYNVLSTTCHELIHIEQYHTGSLTYRGRQFVWKGKTLNEMGLPSDYGSVNQDEYFNLPWERDANTRMGSLAAYVIKKMPKLERFDLRDFIYKVE